MSACFCDTIGQEQIWQNWLCMWTTWRNSQIKINKYSLKPDLSHCIYWNIYDRGILEIVATVKGEDVDKLCDTIYENTIKLFF